MDDHTSGIGDWDPLSPSPRTFFTSLLGGDSSGLGLRPVSKDNGENRNERNFFGFQKQMVSLGEKDGRQTAAGASTSTGFGSSQMTELSPFPEQKSSSRGGLVDRIAARAGFNAPRLNTESIRCANQSLAPNVQSPYLTIPPGLSPTTLLDSPVFLSNSLAQPSPTTGKFPFIPNGNERSSTLISDSHDRSKDNPFQASNSSFAFKPLAETNSSFFLGAANKMSQTTAQSFSTVEVSSQAGNSFPSLGPAKGHSQNGDAFRLQVDPSVAETDTRENGMGAVSVMIDTADGTDENSPPLEEQQADEGDKKGIGDSIMGGAPAEDGYNWRKYGQKQVKGSEYPRSYFKCTHPNCQVKKKVERSHEGHITEIIYKGAHNHPKPPPNRRSSLGSSHALSDMQYENFEQAGLQNGVDADAVWLGQPNEATTGVSDWRNDSIEVTSSSSKGPGYSNPSSALQNQNVAQLESGDVVDASSTFSNDEDEEDRATHGSVSLGYDVEGDESESKRRKIDAYTPEMSGASRAIREPRVVVQTTSEVDILDDGYRWRKYGQKVVKGNPNPRSYYKCTSAGCTVRKHVERASHDLKSVITTYEGKHNHDVPAARNTSHVNSAASNATTSQVSIQNNIHRPDPSQIRNSMARFDRPNTLGSFGLPARQQIGHPNAFSFGMNQPGLTNLAMAGLGPGQAKMPMLPVHPFHAQQQRHMNEMGFLMPKGEPKMEPMSDPGLDLSNGSSVYQQFINRLPLGPQM